LSNYTTRPLRIHVDTLTEDILKIGYVFRKVLQEPTDLNDYHAGCGEACGECPICISARTAAAAMLTNPHTWAWEVYSKDPVDFVGILMLSEVDPGRDATAHFKFFDGALRDKNEVLRSWFDWAFRKFDLRRISAEVPHYAFSLLKAYKRLGFGGNFKYKEFDVEGIKRGVMQEKDRPVDIIILGKMRDGD
jgi:hypothetical protein